MEARQRDFLIGLSAGIAVTSLAALAINWRKADDEERGSGVYHSISLPVPIKKRAPTPLPPISEDILMACIPGPRKCPQSNVDIATLVVHADRNVDDLPDVAPAIRMSTTFKRKNNPQGLIYSRTDRVPTRNRAEVILGALVGGRALTYSSGLSALAALVCYARCPSVVCDVKYHGSPKVIQVLRGRGQDLNIIPVDQALTMTTEQLKEAKVGLVIIEAPNNPFCTFTHLLTLAKMAKDCGAVFAVDATIASIIGMDPFEIGADIVMHSATKTTGGHSDILAGVLMTRREAIGNSLEHQRGYLGSVLGGLESFLLVRSLRTLPLRVERQCASALVVARFLHSHPKVRRVWHPYVETHPDYELGKQVLKLPPSTFGVEFLTGKMAQTLCKKLKYFTEATSLGGVESLVDWRHQYDDSIDPSLLRLSIGLEHPQDLIEDLNTCLHEYDEEEK